MAKRPPTASRLNATPEQDAALDELIKAETKAIEDFNKGLIDFNQATNELKSLAKQYGRDAGLTLRSLKIRQDGQRDDLLAGSNIPVLRPAARPSNERAAEWADNLAPALGKPAYEAGRLARADAAMKKGGAAGVGGALTIADMIVGKLADGVNAATAGVKLLGEVSSRAASNDGLGALNAVADSTASALEKVPIAGKLWAAEVRAAIAPINALAKTAEAFVQRGRELAQYNGPIAREAAVAQVRGVFRDIDEGRRFQKEYGDLIRAQSRLDGATQDAMNELKAAILPILPQLVDYLSVGAMAAKGMIQDMVAIKDGITKAIDAIPSWLSPGLGVLRMINDQVKNAAKVLEDKQRMEDAARGMALDNLFAARTRLPAVGVADPAAEAARVKIGVPLLNR